MTDEPSSNATLSLPLSGLSCQLLLGPHDSFAKCCLCTCSGICWWTLPNCLDPDAGDEFHECKASPPAALSCPAEAQRTWVVEDSEQAHALAEAVNCSGGSFEVEWRGAVIVETPFFIGVGTTLAISGADSSAVIDGNGGTRLFTVVNATLHLSSVSVASGNSTVVQSDRPEHSYRCPETPIRCYNAGVYLMPNSHDDSLTVTIMIELVDLRVVALSCKAF